MEPLSIATSFAAVVSLIGQFRSENSDKEQVDFNEFLEWLVKTQHEDVKELLVTNTKAMIGLKAILKEDRKVIFSKLDYLNNALSKYASGIDGFSDIANAISPNLSLSNQSISILTQFEKSGASKMLKVEHIGGTNFLFMDGDGDLEILEPRFVDDDFKTLIEFGLLRLEFNSKGDDLYIFTRVASNLVSSINSDI